MIDPELVKQINATPKDGVVVAVMYLKGSPAPGKPTQDAIRALLKKCEKEGRPSVVNVFDNLSSFVVCGDPTFIMYLALQPEIERAVPNAGSV